MSDSTSLVRLLYQLHPDRVYNLGAKSHVRVSFDIPEYTGDITGLGTTRLLEALCVTGIKTKVYRASSSEMYGDVVETPQNENTPFRPCNPYACAKVYLCLDDGQLSGWLRIILMPRHPVQPRVPTPWRDCCKPKNPPSGGTHQSGVAGQTISLGNLDAKRDWGYAPEYVEAMWQMLQLEKPRDFCRGHRRDEHTVREFAGVGFRVRRAGLAQSC